MALEFIFIFCMIDDDDNEDEDSSDEKSVRRHCQSNFIYLFNSGNKQALLNCCGVDHKVFCNLLDLFQLVFNLYMRMEYQKEENERRMQHVLLKDALEKSLFVARVEKVMKLDWQCRRTAILGVHVLSFSTLFIRRIFIFIIIIVYHTEDENELKCHDSGRFKHYDC
eukprot:jgi/Psemu1/20787/gm1.20787_g